MDPQVNHQIGFVPQGVAADLIASLEGFARQDVDAYAVRSHQRAAQAQAAGYFHRSLVPVHDLNGLPLLDHDELIRAGTTLAGLAKLNPSFALPGKLGFDATALRKYTTLEAIEHVHHAGNSSGVVDGAALVLLGSEEIGRELGLRPRARVVSCAVVGSEPTIMLTGTTPAARRALAKAGMQVSDVDLFEINEAFAVVPLKTARDLGVELERVNVNGGAIALGHPLGATGAMLLGTLLDELERRDSSTGLVTLCAGGGMGIATVLERV
ncbi:MAG TPA: acetyl-CoA C-acyltransferase, partial [Polyangiaceae bacterium]|nr:acetyl-CoA C-acyltransferase [Polyangiaceae bacterium]